MCVNCAARGGERGVATLLGGVYSGDLLTAPAATFWDGQRIEVLRGPQGTLYGRNAVGGAINILYKEPSQQVEYAMKGIVGNYGTNEYYGMVSGPLVQDVLSGRVNFAVRDRDGVIDDIGGHDDLDSLGTENIAGLFKWTPTNSITISGRANAMRIDRNFGGANGAGLVVLNEEGRPERNTTDLIPGFRQVDLNNTNVANYEQSDFYVTSRPVREFTDPVTGATVYAQHNRPGIDFYDGNGFQNAAASMDGFNVTSPESAALLNSCVFPGDIDGDEVCASTNGLNREEFDQNGIQLTAEWDVSETVQLKYIYGHNDLSYYRTTDDDNTHSMYHDRQFYVNHEANYSSHELQAFYDIGDSWSFTSGIFFYDAIIDQRGDFYSAVGEARFIDPYVDNTGIAGLLFGGTPMATLHMAREICQTAANPAPSCERNYAVENPDLANNNLYISTWQGDDGSNGDLDVSHGPNTLGSDLLYHTQTEREAFAAYTQGVWDISQTFTLTLGIRYAYDDVTAEENLFRYTEAAGSAFVAGAFGISLADYNKFNGGLVPDANHPNGWSATPKVVNGGIPIAVSVYRPFDRRDEKVTGRINLDWNVSPGTMFYLSATSSYRSGGYNLVFFSATPSYDPEELIAYELGYKTQMLNDTVQLNGAFYYYDYENIHTVATEVTPGLLPGSAATTTTSTLEAPGAAIYGAEAEVLWLATEHLSLGGNFSFTPSEYTEDLFIKDPADIDTPGSLFPSYEGQVQNINGNQLLQVPEGKFTLWGSYLFNLANGSNLETSTSYSWIDDVYYSPFESEDEMAESYGRLDLRASWTSASRRWEVTGFVNNVLDEVGVLQILREGEDEGFRHAAGTTVPRLYGLEVSYTFQ
ncbi:MAG: TonB-dependent receptor [Pseudomonadales bacterium]|nr:TonB-dependent receptor [Pseudomonadales bacterium]